MLNGKIELVDLEEPACPMTTYGDEAVKDTCSSELLTKTSLETSHKSATIGS